ncbi:MAG: DNA polymerase III subunit gamma/tau [Verrucomicrobia bacterium]|nr:MAG: DNA polymerase III subunit gamma/tau [Verrucomicrobiota bacterium]PYL37107.1 MAG: DNA polymerase III subunit gamma/tau [Verrucomicrobiota bacterium]
MSYEVFARKYRPQTFDDLVGQSHVSQTLKNAVAQNRLAHAYLFVGPRGIGKTSTARILAKALNCVNGPTVTPCGVCDNCREITAGNSLDVIEIDGASNNSVEDVRELRDNVRYAPAKGRYKIYLIDEVHMLSSAAFNALLKTLEEPPPHVKFIFATTEPQKVLPTILSRCQRFDLHRIPANLIAQHLQFIADKEKFSLERAAAHAIARGAEGGLRDAESMLDQLVAFCGDPISEADVLKVFGFTSQQTVANFTDKILRSATADAVQLLHEQCEAGKDMMRLMADLISYLRDLLVFKVKPNALSEDVDLDSQKSLAAQAELIETDRLLELIDQFAEAEGRMKWAPNKKLHFEVALIKAIQSLSQVTLNEVIENLNALRDGKDVTTKKAVAGPAAITDGGFKKSKSARVAEQPSQYMASKSDVTVDPNKIWEQVCAKIPARGFLRTLVDSLTVLGTEGRSFLLGYPADEKSAIETLATTSNRRQLETLLKEISGRDWTAKLSAKEGLPGKSSREQPSRKAEEFKDDPLIQEALEIFKGEIKS